MATLTFFNIFSEDLAEGVHDFDAATQNMMVALCSDTGWAPTTDAVLADVTQVANGNGYTTGGNTAGNSTTSRTGTTTTVRGSQDPATWTCATAPMGPFRYAVLYNETTTVKTDPLIGYWDYGSNVTLQVGETFKVDLNGTWDLFTIG